MAGMEVGPGFSFDVRRWTPREWVVGVASTVMLISLFLPWFRVSVMGLRMELAGVRSGAAWGAFVLALAVVALLVLRAGFGRVPFAPPPGDRHLLIGGTCLNLVLVLLAFLDKPTIQGVPDAAVATGIVTSSQTLGAFLALVAAAVAAVAAIVRDPAPRA